MTEPIEPANGVRVTNAEIYRLLLEANGRVSSVQQTMEQVVLPTLTNHAAALDRKAEKDALSATDGRVQAIQMRVYAITSGLVAAVLGAKGLGIL